MIQTEHPAPWAPGPSAIPALGEGVHVWRVALHRSPGQLAELSRSLSAEERARADRFYFERDRSAWLAARGSLRQLLARYLGRGPAGLSFSYGPQGKPSLTGEELSFNLAHSGSLALIALCQGAAIGVDLEVIPDAFPGEEVARRFFSADERRLLFARRGPERRDAFFTYWTRKEAIIKAVGGGLSIPLDQFDVDWPGLQGPAVRFRAVDAPGAWSLVDLFPAQGYAAAVALNSTSRPLSCWSAP